MGTRVGVGIRVGTIISVTKEVNSDIKPKITFEIIPPTFSMTVLSAWPF